jgi:hypothetical protein
VAKACKWLSDSGPGWKRPGSTNYFLSATGRKQDFLRELLRLDRFVDAGGVDRHPFRESQAALYFPRRWPLPACCRVI